MPGDKPVEKDKVNILMVDDQPGKLLSYEVVLSELGENLIQAQSARDALEQLLKRDIAVILIDVCMPELDGFELAALIREHPRFQATSIIFVSAIALTDIDRLKGYEYGAVDYVPVPVVPELLRAKVKVFAELYRKTRQLESLNAELERRVADRTAELAQANAELERRVEERTQEREAALAQVYEMQKMESLGQLTGGLAHDFNNLLTAVMGNLEVLSKRLPDDARMKRLVDGAMQGAQRGAALTKRMLAFARRQELAPETVDVPKLVGGLLDMLQRSIGPTVQINTQFESNLPPTRVDPNQFELALLNLALNARDAMPGGGQLLVDARGHVVTDGAGHGLRPGEYVCITVSDNGHGMDPVTLKRASEPFFTTKGVGKGTGLGLSMVHGFAAQSRGTMRLSSELGVGTAVQIWLPVAQEDQSAPRLVCCEPASDVRNCRILIVDDDFMTRTSTAAMLEDLGHTVMEAGSAIAALDLLNTEPDLDLVITDYAMPAMTGAELAAHIRQIRPNLPVILASGFVDFAEGLDPTLPRLAKPYTQTEMMGLISAVLSSFKPFNVLPFTAARTA